MPNQAKILEGVHKKWILKDSLNKGVDKDVWSAFDFTEYLEKAGLEYENITINDMTRHRFLQECQFILGKPNYAVRFLTDPGHEALDRFSNTVEVLNKINDPRIVKVFDYMLIKEEEHKPAEPEEPVYRGSMQDGYQPYALQQQQLQQQKKEDEEEEEEKPEPFYVMELIEGDLLEDKAGEEKAFEGKVNESLAFMKEVGSALVSAHDAGIIHSDLNPKNVFVRTDGAPVIIDFGICHFINGRRFVLAGETDQAINFVAPELSASLINENEICPANDIYTFGKLLYYMISGGETLPREQHHKEGYDLRQKYPSRLMSLVYRILDQTICGNIGARVQTIEDLLTMINREMVEGTKCIYCKTGHYQPVESDMLTGFGNGQETSKDQYIARPFVCDKCGNIQHFVDTNIVRLTE